MTVSPTPHMDLSDGWLRSVPGLADMDGADVRRLLQSAQVVELPAATAVFRAGDACNSFLLVLDGVVRVQMCSENGREIVLYRVDAGDTCVLTTACLLGSETYSADGVSETPVRAVAIPAGVFHELMACSAVLRDFVFKSYGARLANLMMLVQEVAFARVDVRLARFLGARAEDASTLSLTHQKLAFELGSAREVISRQLKEFERRGLLTLRRGQITVLDPEKLRHLASGDG